MTFSIWIRSGWKRLPQRAPRFGRLSLRVELLGAFAVVVGLAFAVAAASLRSHEFSDQAATKLIEVDGRIAELCARSSAALDRARRAERDFLMYRNALGVAEAKARYVTPCARALG